jgi:ATP-binding protein involved in chromosome partitioning
MLDPRENIINKRLERVKHIIAVSSGKGGVGKSLVASTLALTLTRKNFKVGLFDLDFTSPSTHLILGVKNAKPKEKRGIIPAQVHGLKYVSIVALLKGNAIAFKGHRRFKRPHRTFCHDNMGRFRLPNNRHALRE